MHITIKQLKAFRAVASLGQVRLAASQLHLSQPATSMAIAELENQLNCQLFDRTGNKLLLNHQGQQLLPLASELLDRTLEIEKLFSNPDICSGQVKLGASTTIGNYLLPSKLASLNGEAPGVHITMDIRNTTDVIERLTTFELDIGCVEGPCHHDDIEIIPWQEDELTIITAPDHPLASKAKVTLDDLDSADWILREPGSGTRTLFDRFLGHRLAELSVKMELNQAEAIKKLVQTGTGISCLSHLCIKRELEQGELAAIHIDGVQLKRQLSLLLHKKKYRSPLISWVLEQLQLADG